MKWLRLLMLAIVAAAVAILSFVTLRDLAKMCGVKDYLAWLLPIGIDAGGIAASLIWADRQAPPGVRKFGATITIGAVILSVIGNAAQHVLATSHKGAPLWLVITVAAVPPLILGCVAHLVITGGQTPAPPADPHDSAVSLTEADLDTVFAAANEWVALAKNASDHQRNAIAQAFVKTFGKVGRPTLVDQFGFTDYEAKQFLAAAKDEPAELAEAVAP